MNDFFANLYEMFGAFRGDFYNHMYHEVYYVQLGIIMIVSTLLIAVLFYYGLNHPRVSRWYHWTFFALGASIINFVIDWIVAEDKLIRFFNEAQLDMSFTWDYFFTLALMGFVWSLVFFFLFSFVIKWGSRNCKHTPFL